MKKPYGTFASTKDRLIEPMLRIFGEPMVEARKRCGFGRKKLAELSGVHEITVKRIELGYRMISLDTLLKIGKVLEWKPSIILADYEELIEEVDKHGGLESFEEVKGSRASRAAARLRSQQSVP